MNDRILGAGQLGDGQMKLVNDAAGIIYGDDTIALIINTGANTIANAGEIAATAAGGTTIRSAIDNTGSLVADGGKLTVAGAVTGAGSARISAGTADFNSTFAENAIFGLTGILELARSQTYTGAIAGFSKTGTTSLDLDDIAFGAKTRATYAGTTTSGVLTITDGTHTARINFAGNYTGTSFDVSSDSHGGTSVVDKPTPAKPDALPFISAVAGAAGGAATPSTEQSPAQSLLASPTV